MSSRPVRPTAYGRPGFSSLLAGRLATAAAILTFVASYAFGISQYGWWFWLAVGWLPSAACAWLIAQVLASGMRYVIRSGQLELQSVSGISFPSAPFCCLGRVSTAQRSRRQDK